MRRSFAGLALDRPLVMGVVNATPDSFWPESRAAGIEAVRARGRALVAAGADLLDVGGESTRPGAAPVSLDEELARVVPAVAAVAEFGVPVSVDTRRAAVMRAALAAGARLVNDVTALAGDPDSPAVVAASGAPAILMHMRGEPATMQDRPAYDDVVAEVRAWLAERIAACVAAGIPRDRLAIDPGIGFGKTAAHNAALIRHLAALKDLGCPVVLGVSRKRFVADVSRGEPPEQRLAGSLAAVLAGVRYGADVVRVHDVAETRQALAVWQAVG